MEKQLKIDSDKQAAQLEQMEQKQPVYYASNSEM